MLLATKSIAAFKTPSCPQCDACQLFLRISHKAQLSQREPPSGRQLEALSVALPKAVPHARIVLLRTYEALRPMGCGRPLTDGRFATTQNLGRGLCAGCHGHVGSQPTQRACTPVPPTRHVEVRPDKVAVQCRGVPHHEVTSLQLRLHRRSGELLLESTVPIRYTEVLMVWAHDVQKLPIALLVEPRVQLVRTRDQHETASRGRRRRELHNALHALEAWLAARVLVHVPPVISAHVQARILEAEGGRPVKGHD
mmetsp:Transcript_59199/g.183700  ORF Transcript_59199/g.183700 Transcript_59199/m.183700 type:complete len:253 (+) Transcript_59199:66-824(+)